KLAGSREVMVIPVGSTTQVRMQSDWPHPSFQGAFLPAQRAITANGFDARWQVLALNRSYGQVFSESQLEPETLLTSALGTSLHQAIDVYQRGERATKYAALFIALTFLTFFAWEHLSRSRLHPLQYLLVGLALSIFYLLLIALSEHIAFVLASRGDEESQEYAQSRHGLFTYALLEGLRGGADRNRDRRVTVEEWFGFAAAASTNCAIARSVLRRHSWSRHLRCGE
ncbi:MAG: cell envelope integrity protein CreD, partial [Gammaproteobacteria bacterium]|nr:cell envelope integrity protein CreD [Gammaproteobacteria bacterium]